MIALVDYGAGNLTSVRKALSALGAGHFTPAAPEELLQASAIIVPGVGHFDATAALDDGWRRMVRDLCHGERVPLLGICLGMQWLFEGSDEAAHLPGLGYFPGRCTRLPADDRTRVKVPHVGWNTLEIASDSPLLRDVHDGDQVYFTHSYAAPMTADGVAATTHGARFAAAVGTKNVMGVQFHPEKSGDVGLRILRNFLEVGRDPLGATHIT